MSALIPRVVRRATNLIDISLNNVAGVSRFSVRGHKTLNGAFASSEELFQVDSKSMYRSTSVILQNVPEYIHPSNLALGFRAQFNLNDFANPSNNIPLDSDYFFLRIASLNNAGSVIEEGPILVVLPTISKGNQYPTLSIGGTVPALSSAALGSKAPFGCLIVALGGQGHQIDIKNYDTTEDLFISFEESEGMVKITPNQKDYFRASRTGLVFLCTDGGAPIEFSLYAALLSD